jgi:arylsulfatase A-like enzyme
MIMTDQQSRSMMSCAGNPYLKTPAMDSLAESGVRFSRAYCTNPVCVPSRFSLFTGRMASEIKLKGTGPVGVEKIADEIKKTGLGWTLKNGGYDAVFAGKQHLPKMNVEDLGFDVLTHDERDELASTAADFVSNDHDKPWFLVASFINPHDICYMAIQDNKNGLAPLEPEDDVSLEVRELYEWLDSAKKIPEDEFFETHCPPLPPNFEPQQDEPEALRALIEKRIFRANARRDWDEHKWRMHRWVYARLTERVDGQIQVLLDALKSSPARDNTVIIFTSDHGDHDSSHRLEHKTMPYEEAAGVPLIIAESNSSSGVVDESNLVSNGLDLFPTICDYAGIDVPPHIQGKSLRPLVEGKAWDEPRQVVPIECEIGNAVVSLKRKYLSCFSGEAPEQFYDLEADPHETRNAAADADQEAALEKHRRYFAQHHASQ